MKKLVFLSPFLLTLMFLIHACSNYNSKKNDTVNTKISKTKAGEYNVDTEKSVVEWLGKKTTGSHNGHIKIKTGDIGIDKEGYISYGGFILDMTSIECTDLEGKRKKSLEDHLKDPDFFNTKEFPMASFIIDQYGHENEKNILYGILTIKDIHRRISFEYEQIDVLTYKAEITVDRTLFDIKYKSKTFMPDIGDHFIYDNFIITLNPIIFK